MSRPNVNVFSLTGEASGAVPLPEVFRAPIRNDCVRFVHTNISKNARQAYAVTRHAGHRATAESWGTGRAVSRIPRVGGGGTHRSGEGAYGNMCRGGRMFAPTKVFRRWHRRVNQKLRQYAVASAVAASGIPSLVIARGHNIQRVPEIPLVISAVNTLKKTKEAVKLLKAINAYPDVEKAKTTSKIRPGQGKSRNRRYVNRKGPLLVLNKNEGGWSAFRNLPGVDLCYVSALNLLQLAPGSHLGRFIIWSEAAFRELNNVFGTYQEGAKTRSFRLPRPVVANADVTRIINSDEVRSVLRPRRKNKRRGVVGHNPLRSARAYAKVSPLGKILRKQQESRKRNKLALKALKRSGKFKRAGKKSDAARKAAAKAAWAKGGKKVKVIRQTGFSKNAAAKKASKKGTKKAAGRAPPPKSA